jgi:hypothetical protein
MSRAWPKSEPGLSGNNRLDKKKFVWAKCSSFVCDNISDGEKKFYNIVTGFFVGVTG